MTTYWQDQACYSELAWPISAIAGLSLVGRSNGRQGTIEKIENTAIDGKDKRENVNEKEVTGEWQDGELEKEREQEGGKMEVTMMIRTNLPRSAHNLTNLLEASAAVLANVWSLIVPCSITTVCVWLLHAFSQWPALCGMLCNDATTLWKTLLGNGKC